MANPIYFYSKTNEWYELSNFYLHGFEDDDGLYWKTVEHYFQAMKFSAPDQAEYREKIRTAKTPKLAKDLGRSTKVLLRKDWEEVKEDVMLYALRKKFTHPKMQNILFRTRKRHLYEDSPFDSYWGIGRNRKGKNRLGELLMQVREELQQKT